VIGLTSRVHAIYSFITKQSSFNIEELINNLDITVDPFFTPAELDQMASETAFVQRKSKLNGRLFLDLIVFNSDNLKSQSLNDLTIALYDRHQVEITKQSLHDRFNEYALAFLKIALEKMLYKQIGVRLDLLKDFEIFNRILLKDSTCFQLHDSLADCYPGSGGSGSEASVRIQFEYDLLSGKINDLSVNAFNDQDAQDSLDTIELTGQGDLIIRDLAYMSLDVLELIETQYAFYLCRAKTNVNIYEQKEGQYIKIDFAKIATQMKTNAIECWEKEVYLGSKDKIKTRLILQLVPEQVVSERLRKAAKYNKKKGGNGLSKEFKARAALNLFITNANQEQIPTKHIWQLYRLRWQIELIFKIWKSICSIEKVKKVKKERLECYIYSKLLLIALLWGILWKTAKRLFDNEKKPMSFFKASKTLLKVKLDDLRNIFVLRKHDLQDFMGNFYNLSRKKHILEKHSDVPTSFERLMYYLNN